MTCQFRYLKIFGMATGRSKLDSLIHLRREYWQRDGYHCLRASLKQVRAVRVRLPLQPMDLHLQCAMGLRGCQFAVVFAWPERPGHQVLPSH